jgi:GT2 family glycosyltransferase
MGAVSHSMPTLSVIIYNSNGCHELKRTLSQNCDILRKNGVTDIILCDDASDDDSLIYLSTHFSDIRCIQNNWIKGRDRTFNKAVQHVTGDALMFLTSDIVLKTVNIAALIALCQRSDIFAVSPRIMRSGSPFIQTKGRLEKGHVIFNAIEISDNDTSSDAELPMLWAPDGIMMMMKHKFDYLNGYDTTISECYPAEIDLCYRAWKMGWKTQSTPAWICHSFYLIEENTLLTTPYCYHGRPPLFVWQHITHIPTLILHVICVIISCMSFRLADIRAIFRSLRHLPYIISKRKNMPSYRLSESEIFSFWRHS